MEKRLLLIGSIFPPDIGGPASFLSEFSKWAAAQSTSVQVVATSESSDDKFELDGVNHHLVHRGSLPVRTLRLILAIRSNYKPGISVLSVGAFIETFVALIGTKSKRSVKIPGDIVWERARNNGVTKLDILSFQNSSIPWKYRIFKYLFHLSLKNSELVIVPSVGIGKLCESWGIRQEKIAVVYNSVKPVPDSVRFADSKFDLLTVCRLTRWKGVSEIIKATSKLNLSFAVVGDGPERHELEILARNNHANVTFFGSLPRDQVIGLFQASDCFILNSEYEGLPHVVLEAREMEIPIIARMGTGTDEVISHLETGLLVRGDSDSLISAIQFLQSNTEIVNLMTKNGKLDNRARFNSELNFQRILRLI